MDRITESMMEAFNHDLNLNLIDNKDLLFEYFANYCVVSSVYGSGNFEIYDVTTGKDTQGIDGIAIIV